MPRSARDRIDGGAARVPPGMNRRPLILLAALAAILAVAVTAVAGAHAPAKHQRAVKVARGATTVKLTATLPGVTITAAQAGQGRQRRHRLPDRARPRQGRPLARRDPPRRRAEARQGQQDRRPAPPAGRPARRRVAAGRPRQGRPPARAGQARPHGRDPEGRGPQGHRDRRQADPDRRRVQGARAGPSASTSPPGPPSAPPTCRPGSSGAGPSTAAAPTTTRSRRSSPSRRHGTATGEGGPKWPPSPRPGSSHGPAGALHSAADRARRGISGALYSQSALARPNSLPRGAACGVSAPARRRWPWVPARRRPVNQVRSGRKQP